MPTNLIELLGIVALETAENDDGVTGFRKTRSFFLPFYSSITNSFKNLNCFWAFFGNIF